MATELKYTLFEDNFLQNCKE